MNQAQALAIDRIVLPVADLGRSRVFYAALGFTIDHELLRLGDETIELVAGSGSYPDPRAANDPWFQHFAIAVSDADAAFARLQGLDFSPITTGGPQLLPPNTGSVVAYKFRDPDGHPLEFSYEPGSRWAAMGKAETFLGIDHTALAVADLAASLAFYEALGFREIGRSLNTGVEQDRLDGLTGVAVEIVALAPHDPGPHIELLHYLTPTSAPPRPVADGDIAAIRTSIRITGTAVNLRDPDGHRLDLHS